MEEAAKGDVIGPFRAAQAARLAGLSLDMLNYLCRHAIVLPSSGGGRGRARLYAYEDVLLMRVMAQLLSQGVSVLGLRRSLADHRQKTGRLGVATCRFFVTDGYNVLLRDADTLVDVTSGQHVFSFVLDLQPVRDAVDNNMKLAFSVANG
jgi:DNA-binding transcriptional MerR regulator